jgi:O-antigen/teichoic acid export membrane protein
LATILVAILLPPVIIARIGFKTYTVWMLALSFIDYFWLSDFGLRAATVNFSARYWAERNFTRLSEVLACSMIFSSAMGAVVAAGIYFAAPSMAAFFHLAGDANFILLLRLVSASWAAMLVFTAFSSCLEGCQRFDLTNRAWVASLIARVLGIYTIVETSGELAHMGYVLVLAQLLWCVLVFGLLRQTLPRVRINPLLANREMFASMWDYGIHSFIGGFSNFLLNKSIQPMTARFLGSEAFGVYFLPRRILDYAMEGVGRIGMVTAPNATEMNTTGDKDSLTELGIYANRYSFAMFVAAAAFLAVFGADVIGLWLHAAPESARYAAALLPALLIGQTIAAGQFNSASILFGMGRHKVYSRFVFAEGVVVILANLALLPTWGLLPAVWAGSAAMAINRGLILNMLVTRELGVNPWAYARAIYAVPAALAAVEVALLAALRAAVHPDGWSGIALAGLLLAVTYIPLMLRYGVAPHHRQWICATLRDMQLPARAKGSPQTGDTAQMP